MENYFGEFLDQIPPTQSFLRKRVFEFKKTFFANKNVKVICFVTVSMVNSISKILVKKILLLTFLFAQNAFF